MTKIYRIGIQDGNREYDLLTEDCPKLDNKNNDVNEEIVDNFTRVIKQVETFEATEQEIKTLEKFGMI